jgi:hypothetical protein
MVSSRRWTSIVLGALCWLPGSALAADDGVADNIARVTGTLVLPAELESFDRRRLELRLYKIHPLLADAPADLVDLEEVEDFSHEQGKETKQAFEIGGEAALEPDKSYYLTCFVLDGNTRTHIGETADKNLCSVLTLGKPREVSLTGRAVR